MARVPQDTSANEVVMLAAPSHVHQYDILPLVDLSFAPLDALPGDLQGISSIFALPILLNPLPVLPRRLSTRVPATAARPPSHRQPSPSSPSRKLCGVPGCVKFARSQGMCTQHGGRRYCDAFQCPRVAQFAGKCTAHGGVKPCNVPGCLKAVQSRGKCKTHGGGVRCKAPGCAKGSISSGYCRGHGGGMRCAAPGCDKWAQRKGLCVRHHHSSAIQTTEVLL